MFISHEPYYVQNIADGRSLKVRAAGIQDPDGQRINAIALFNGSHLRFCIPVDDAIRLANEIADAADSHDAHAQRKQ